MNFRRFGAVFTASLLCSSSLMSLTPVSAASLCGDINNDNQITVSDAILISRISVSDITLDISDSAGTADVNFDGVVNGMDVTRVLQYVAKFITAEEFFAEVQTTTSTNESTAYETTTTLSDDGYDRSGFAWQWPEVFSIDDTVTITDRSYQSHDVAINITDHLSDNLAYFVADIYVRDIECFRGAFAKGSYMKPRSAQLDSVQNMAADNNAILAINADYCEIRDTGIIYRNGVLYRDVKKGDVGTVYTNGVMDVFTKNEFSALMAEDKTDIWHTFSFGPYLVRDGVALTNIVSSISEENPRSGIGYYEPGHYCFVMVDGRQEGYSMGLTLDDFAALFDELGCASAFNLDGGRSSELVFNGKTIDKPYLGGRYSSDILYICEKPNP